MANVIFKVGTLAQYQALEAKNAQTLYWLTDVQRVYKGDVLFGSGTLATTAMAGLLSPEDKAKLDAITSSGNTVDVSALDPSIRIDEGKIGVQLSAVEGNAIVLKDDGLFVPVPAIPIIPTYEMEKQDTAADGYAATYKLKCISGDVVSYCGDEINIPKDMVLQGGTMETVLVDGVPYEGAKIGDPYIDLVLSDPNNSHIYIPVTGLIDVYIAGKGIEINDGVVAIKLHPVEANGLFIDDDGIGLKLATIESAGAMSPEDKIALNTIPDMYATINEVTELRSTVTEIEESFTWGDM